jgi:hypothetical protein
MLTFSTASPPKQWATTISGRKGFSCNFSLSNDSEEKRMETPVLYFSSAAERQQEPLRNY